VGTKKIAVLGGGAGAMTAAFALTDPENPNGPYDVTVYTVGWRLGGKGASGRMPDGRILEHGLHVWGGFYENAFRMMDRCYRELGRPPGTPLSTCFPPGPGREDEGAFRSENHVVFTEHIGGKWLPWSIDFSEWCLSNCRPGNNTENFRSLYFYFAHALDLLLHVIDNAIAASDPGLKRAIEELNRLLNRWISGDEAGSGEPSNPVGRLKRVLEAEGERAAAELFDAVLVLLDSIRNAVWANVQSVLDTDTNLRRLWLVSDFAIAILRGAIRDDLFHKGFESIEDVEWSEWLKRNGLSEYTLHSVLVTGYYDYFFAYLDGDASKPCMSAGSALMHLLRMMFTFDEAIFWKMNSGMGDAVFAPLYQVLKRRGVRFHFFHQVQRLELSADASELAGIHIGRQVDLASGVDEYRPLGKDCGGVPCWPAEPYYDQLNPEQAARLRQCPMAVEALDPNWPTTPLTLRAGEDFDGAVLAITMEPMRTVCAELAEGRQPAAAQWKALLAGNKTVQTLAAQVWFEPELSQLGWPGPRPVLTGFAQPQSTWSDMTQVLVREGWPPGGPRTLAYFCGQLADSPDLPPAWSPGFQAQQDDRVKKLTIDWMESKLPDLMPNLEQHGDFQWNDCYSHGAATGSARFDSQYWRANVSGPERYVLTLPGNQRYRPRDGVSGYKRLWVAGDWVFTCLGGCVEAAAIGGLMASRAISGYPVCINGKVGP
jgi:uncharacterized protein with NAD-binding domain and iron-sulfur cluster